jgi:hypothetical protein
MHLARCVSHAGLVFCMHVTPVPRQHGFFYWPQRGVQT